jgi:hypothetical protein
VKSPSCKHPTVWPDGVCTECGVLATAAPGLTTTHHKIIHRPVTYTTEVDFKRYLQQRSRYVHL